MPIIGKETYQDKHFIVVWCPGGETRHYSSPKTMVNDNKDRIHYICKASNTAVKPADGEEKDLFNLANRVLFDDRVNHQTEMSDLNITIIQNYLKEIKSSLYEKSKTCDFIEVCQDMNIVSTLPKYIKPKNVVLMFFSMEPDKLFPYTQIDVVQFSSGLGGDDIIEKTFKEPIQQLRDALQYIRNAVIMEKVIKHPDRAEVDRFFNFPYAAIEEALSNAVYHRAYDEREPIEVRVENDRIEVVSFPKPDCSATMEGLKSYRVLNRRYRNRRIGDFLKELNLTEGRNTGFKKTLDALEANSSPKPEFETDEDRSYFITRLFVHEEFTKPVNERNMSEVLKQSDFCKVEKIIKLIEEKREITPKEAEAVSGKSAARKYLKMLVGTGYVQTEGNTNNSVYKVSL